MVIVVENAGTSHIPTTIAKKFLIQYKNSMDARKDFTTTL
jgi:hypothetical protein